jgi:dTDP-4-amino-4,6-dideoxygalactose transaminase
MIKTPPPILFTNAQVAGREAEYLGRVLESAKWGGHGAFTEQCVATICRDTGVAHGLLTHSCTAALEMAALIANLQPGDEVILPPFTFVSTGNAVALRGARPVFVDIRPDTLNINESLIEAAVTARTRAIVVVHYAGVCCAMDPIMALAARHGLLVIEDAAQAYLASYHDRPAGSLGDMAAFSFHETKNVTSGEGGAFVTNRPYLAHRAEIVWEKGTDRSMFLRGEVDKYSWVDLGSSYLPSELVAAVLLAQLEQAREITARRREIWDRFFAAFESLEATGLVRRPVVPAECRHNGHLFYLLLSDIAARDAMVAFLRTRGITAPFHYVPLHDSVAGRRYGRVSGELPWSDTLPGRLIRLPLHPALQDSDIDRVIDAVTQGVRDPGIGRW